MYIQYSRLCVVEYKPKSGKRNRKPKPNNNNTESTDIRIRKNKHNRLPKRTTMFVLYEYLIKTKDSLTY